MVYYGNQQRLEYDFNVAPGIDPGAIAMRYDGVDRLDVDSQGDLILTLGADVVRQAKPVLYQTLAGHRRPLEGSYRLLDPHTVGFAVEPFDRSLPLVIDPTLIYSTYFGGNADDILWAVKLNTNDSSIYVAGQTVPVRRVCINQH